MKKSIFVLGYLCLQTISQTNARSKLSYQDNELLVDIDTKGEVDDRMIMELNSGVLWTGCDLDFTDFHENIKLHFNTSGGSFWWGDHRYITPAYLCDTGELCQFEITNYEGHWDFHHRLLDKSTGTHPRFEIRCQDSQPTIKVIMNYRGPNFCAIWMKNLFWSKRGVPQPIHLQFPKGQNNPKLYNPDSGLVKVEDAVMGYTEYHYSPKLRANNK